MSSTASLFPERPPVSHEDELVRYIRLAMDVQKRGMAMGTPPFGATLVGQDVRLLRG